MSGTTDTAYTFAAAVLLMSAFALSHAARQFTIRIKRRWKSLSAGVAAAYVFVQVIPELEAHRPAVAASAVGALLDADKRIYSWALAGFVTLTGLGRLAHRNSRAESAWTYRAEIVGFATYWLLIGYLLVDREDPSLFSLALYDFAMGLHAFMVDSELSEQFGSKYEPRGRVLLAVSVLFGWVLGAADAFPEVFTSRLFAFILGGVVVTSAHDELPAAEDSRFWWFVAGAVGYATILMLV